MRKWALESRRALGAPLDPNVIRMMRACLSIAIIWRDGPCIHTADLTHFPTGAPFGAYRISAEEPDRPHIQPVRTSEKSPFVIPTLAGS